MNSDVSNGDDLTLGGGLDESTRAAGGDGISAKVQEVTGSVRDALANGGGPLVDQAKTFARQRPFAAAALAGVVGLAILNTLRGKR